MVSGSGSGGVDRIGGSGIDAVIRRAVELGRTHEPVVRQQLMALLSEERIREWTNLRVRNTVRAGGTPGPAGSIGKVHQGALNQRLQRLAADLLGPGGVAWESGDAPGDLEAWAAAMPYESRAMLRSRANTIEGGTTEVNKNIVAERVLGLPREPDPFRDAAWEDVPRS
jgi:alkylation response protein AidB-like acyl-CoA dehydrogenase